MSKEFKLFIIDGMALIYRAHFAMIKNPLTTKNGQHTSAIYGFANSIFKLIKDENPDYLVIAMDCKEPTFRHKMYSEYKANREAMPDELVSQLSLIDEMLDGMNIPVIKKPGFEADDVMGTIGKVASAKGLITYLVSGDKDLMQLVSDKVKLYTPASRFSPTKIYNESDVFDKWGVKPNKMIEFLALLGDSSDNIPGVDGIGKKTASKLLSEYGSIDQIVNNIDNIKNKRVKEGLITGSDNLNLAIDLVTIDNNVDIDIEISKFKKIDMNRELLYQYFNKLEIHSLSSQLDKLSNDKTPEKINNNFKKKYELVDTKKKLDSLIQKLEDQSLFSFDIETSELDPIEADIVGFSISYKNNSGYYIPIIFPEKDNTSNYELNLVYVLNSIKKILESDNNKICGQNIKYDSLILKRHGISLSGIRYDSMIAEHILHPDKNSYKLDNLSLEYLGYEMQSIEELIGSGKDQISMADVPLDKTLFYAAEDADIALQISNKSMPLIEKNNLSKPYYEIELPLIPVLVEMENTGVFVDRKILSELSIEIDSMISILKEQIFSISDAEFNLNSPKQLAEVLFDKLELKQIKKRSTSIEVLESLTQHHPLPELILKYRHLSKLSSTYINALPNHINKRTGRVHSSFNQTIASTGRLSSTKPNFQNIPIRTELGKKIRKAIRAQSSDSVILSADYSQIELRIMAHFSNEPELVRSFNEDLDIHTRTAALVYSVDKNDVTSEQRRSAKVVNFGIMYGAGPFRMSKELGIGMKDAKTLIETYFKTYPGIQKYITETIEEAHIKGYVSTINGRKKYSQSLASSNMNVQKAEERALINMPIQGTAAELIKVAMINIQKKIISDDYNAKMILQIHDELIFEVPKNEIENFSKLVKFEMEHAMELSVPLKVEYNSGPSWYDAH
tara:strand:+ start:165 stop:2879 length:2715 start_codon:yes stop_codon:yes gene_type:complete